MEFFICNENKRKLTELIVLPFWEGKKGAENAAQIDKYQNLLNSSAILQDFQGKEGQILFIYGNYKDIDKRIALLGLGKKENISVEKLRRIYSQLTRMCHQKKLEEICILPPKTQLSEEMLMQGMTEGMLLANYTFDKLKELKKTEKLRLLEKVSFIGVSKQGLTYANRWGIIAEGVYIARDLVNGNADDVTPQYLSKFAKEISKKFPKVKVNILDKKQIEKEKMGLLLAVNQGSVRDPALIILSYQGDPKSKEHTILIGKGITYDTGGLNLKPMASMETMKADMAGGAAVIGTIYAAASLHLKTNVTAIIPATENSIDAKSFKIGDVYKSYEGRTIEITNPDAEGRLVLADAITYAKRKLKPTRIIDIATLTGAIEVALGFEACGLFTNNDDLASRFQQASLNTQEKIWRFPLYEEYLESLKSDIGDMKNSAGRSAGSAVAAKFLQEFVGDTPWAHLDIANVAYLSERKRYHPKFGTGFGVRLLIDLLSNEI